MVNNKDTKVSYKGNGQTTVFPFSFPFIKGEYIHVAIYDSLTDTTVTLTKDYYVDTVAKTVNYPGYPPGQEPAEALRPPVLPATSTITIYRETDIDQLTDLGKKYPLPQIEAMSDKLTEILQEQQETLGRAVTVPVGDPKTPEERWTDMQNFVHAAADSASNAALSESSAQRAAEAAATSEANAAESERLASGYADTASDAASRAEDSAISARAYNAPEYDNETTYQAGDVVTYTDGNSYRALQETTGNEPPNIIYWQKVTDYVGDDFFEVDEYGYIVPMDSPSHSRYWRVDQNGYIVPIEGGDGGYRPDTRSLSAEYLNVTNEGYVKHLRADDISAQEVDADEVTADVAAFNTLTANAVNAGTLTANDIIAKGPVVDVRAFGAVGDGVHDDTAAIQAAIDAGNVIYIPDGTYLVSESIVIPSHKTIIGSTPLTAMIKSTVTKPFWIRGSIDGSVYAQNVKVSNIGFDIKALADNSDSIAINQTYAYACEINNVVVDDGAGRLSDNRLGYYAGIGAYTTIVSNLSAGTVKVAGESNDNNWPTTITFINLDCAQVISSRAASLTFLQPILQGTKDKFVLDNINSITITGGDVEGTGVFLNLGANIYGLSASNNETAAFTGTYRTGNYAGPSISADIRNHGALQLIQSALNTWNGNLVNTHHIDPEYGSETLRDATGAGEYIIQPTATELRIYPSNALSNGDIWLLTQKDVRLGTTINNHVGIGTWNDVSDAGLVVAGKIRPSDDNAYDLGASNYRISQIYAANATINTSDARAKTDVNNCEYGLDFLEKIRPVTYKLKVAKKEVNDIECGANEDGTAKYKREISDVAGVRTHVGLIAQEVEAALDGKDLAIFTHDKDSDLYGIRYEEFIPILIKAIQELATKVKS